MSKRIEAYLRTIDPPAMAADQQYFTNSEGGLTQGAAYVPSLAFREMTRLQERLEPAFGDAVERIFACDPRLAGIDPDEPLTIATGVCAFPTDYNAKLNPSNGAGTSRWFDARTGESIPLPPDVADAVAIVIDNPPPLTIANLMKASGLARANTILVEEVDFYVRWTLEKLAANAGLAPTGLAFERAMEPIREPLAAFVRQQFARNRRAFEKLRRLALGDAPMSSVRAVEDTEPNYEACVAEQVARWRTELAGGAELDGSGLRTAAYYSEALTKAYRAIGVLAIDSQLVITESASSLIVPDNGSPFNTARRAAFSQIRAAGNGPLIAAYPSPNLAPSVRKEPLEVGSVTAVPTSRQADLIAYAKMQRDGIAAPGQGIKWSFALPDSPEIASLQRLATMSEVGSATDSELFEAERVVTKKVLDEDA